MRMAQGLLNAAQKERDVLKAEIVGLKEQLETAVGKSDSSENERFIDVSSCLVWVMTVSDIRLSSWNDDMQN
jgi:hypothetical protein